MQQPRVGGRLCRRCNGREAKHQEHIPAHTMILPDRLGVVDASVHRWEVVLRDPHYRLNGEHDVGDEPQDGVWGLKVGMVGLDFVVFDDDQPREEGEDGGSVEDGVDICALTFLYRGVCGLEDEKGLRGQEDAGGVEELTIR